MKIRKARKSDLDQYTEIMVVSNLEYQKLLKKKIDFTRKQIRDTFREFTGSKNKLLFVVEEKKQLIGYLAGSFTINSYLKLGNIDFIFISKDFRKKGIAKSLVKEFTKFLKSKKVEKIRLSVNIDNKKVMNFYKKLGFNLYHYELEKKIK